MRTDENRAAAEGQAPLESWKEIGAYIQRDVRTARRWELEEGLPVHRLNHKSRSSVYAYPNEIDAWRASRKVVPEPAPARPLWKIPAFALTMLLCLVMVGNGIRPVSAQQNKALSSRLVWNVEDQVAPATGDSLAISRDGRWMAFTKITGKGSIELLVRDITTGQVKLLAHDVDPPAISPDGRQVAFNFWGKDELNPDEHGQLRVMATEPGSKPRVLVQAPDIRYCTPAAFSPDGKSVLVTVVRQDWTRQFAWVSLADGGMKQLKSLDWRLRGVASRPSISPDGRYLAYSALAIAPKSNSGSLPSTDKHIYVIAADGSAEAEVVGGASINYGPAWTPDGSHLLFVSNRKGASFDLWSVPIRAGKAAGDLSLVKQEGGQIATIGMTASGSYVYENNVQQGDDIFVQDLDAAGKLRGVATRLSENFVGSNASPAWSPDGKYIAFKRLRPGQGQGYDLVVRSLDTGNERTYHAGPGNTGPGRVIWFLDSKSFTTGFARDGGAAVVYRVDVKTGESKEFRGSFAHSPDDKVLYVATRDPKNPVPNRPDRIVALDLASGQERPVFSLPADGSFIIGPALSPDGRTLAMMVARATPEGKAFGQDNEERLVRVNVDGTGYRELYAPFKLQTPGWGAMLTWTKDGRWILFPQAGQFASPAYGVAFLMRISAEGGKPEPTGLELKGSPLSVDLNPDGSRIVFNRYDEGVRQVWALDNVPSVLK